MVNYNSGQSFLLAGVESTYNTPVSTTKDFGIIGSISPSANNNTIDVRRLGSREAADLLAGNFDASMTVDGTLNSGAIFEMFFGQSTDAVSTSDYRHWFIDKDNNNTAGALTVLNTVNSYTVSENYDSSSDVTYTYGGVVCNSVDINVAVNEVVTISAELLAADVDTGTTAGTKVSTTTVPLTFAECSLSTGAEDSESTLSQVVNFSAAFNNNIDLGDIRGIGSRLAQGALPKNLEITGEFTMKFQNKTEAERFLGGTSAATGTPTDSGLIFDANNGTALGSGRVDFYLRLNGVQYESLGRTTTTDGIVEETFSYRATTIEECYFTDAVSTYF